MRINNNQYSFMHTRNNTFTVKMIEKKKVLFKYFFDVKLK